ncbi:MAG: L,D-transpeptidase [Geodermatophilaceae bacterium]
MSLCPPASPRGRLSPARRDPVGKVELALASVLAAGALAACSGAAHGGGGHQVSSPGAQPVSFSTNLGPGRHAEDVPVDTVVKMSASGGQLDAVHLTFDAGGTQGTVPGTLSKDGTSWVADGLLEPGADYRLGATGTSIDGAPARQISIFSTQDLSLDQQTFPSVAPLRDTTVGVGMPVIVTFDVPVTDRAAAERHLSVESTPAVRGTWHWVDDTEVHYRPRRFWPAGADVTVHADLNGVDVGNGIYGQESREVSFHIGSSVIDRINLRTHRLRVVINGRLARTIPITGGKPGFETRSGTKVIMEKFLSKRMDAATTGIAPSNPEYYNIANVQYAMRVTNSGEFLHAAPWSVADQGSANVSHGCVGMSTANAHWLFDRSHIGDVVIVKGSNRSMEAGNGWTDWNQSYASYKQGSAL